MSNRTKSLERSKVSYHTDCLEALLDSCRRNGRPAKIPPREAAIPSDTEMFRWWLTTGCHISRLWSDFEDGVNLDWSLPQWREWFRKSMKEYYAST